jgi:hypothetical protein
MGNACKVVCKDNGLMQLMGLVIQSKGALRALLSGNGHQLGCPSATLR